jgi:hypothetical protein
VPQCAELLFRPPASPSPSPRPTTRSCASINCTARGQCTRGCSCITATFLCRCNTTAGFRAAGSISSSTVPACFWDFSVNPGYAIPLGAYVDFPFYLRNSTVCAPADAKVVSSIQIPSSTPVDCGNTVFQQLKPSHMAMQPGSIGRHTCLKNVASFCDWRAPAAGGNYSVGRCYRATIVLTDGRRHVTLLKFV